MEFGLLMTDRPVYVSCKFDMYIFKIALVICENVCIAFLYVLSIDLYCSGSINTNGRAMNDTEMSNGNL